MLSKFTTQILMFRPMFGSSLIEFWERSKFSYFGRFYLRKFFFLLHTHVVIITLSKFNTQIIGCRPTFGSSFVEFWEHSKFSCFGRYYYSKFVFLLHKLVVLITVSKFTTQILGSRPTFGSSFVDFWKRSKLSCFARFY